MASAPGRLGPAIPKIVPNAAPELLRVLEQAARIGAASNEEHLYSFTTLLVAIYYSSGPTSEWWHSYADRAGIKVADMLSDLGVRSEDLTKPVPASSSKQGLTVSASNVLEKAEDMRQTMGADLLGVRHVLGSYLFRMPLNHYKHALSWNLNPGKAGTAFLDFLRKNYPGENDVWEQLAATATRDPRSSQVPAAGLDAPVQQVNAADRWSSNTADFKVTAGVTRVLALAKEIVTESSVGLTCRSVFFAIVDFGPIAPGTAAAALYRTIKSSKPLFDRYNSLRRTYNPAIVDLRNIPGLTTSALLSPNMVIIFKRALELTRATTHTEVIGLRHLTTAFLLEGPTLRDGGRLSQALGDLALDSGSFLYRMYQDLRKNLPNEDMIAWEMALFAAGPRDVPDYSADDDKGPDLLNIKDDIEAFAAIMAAHDLHPPLSVGLFGDWGSGKSFFMRMLRERIDGIAGAASREKSKIFCSQIVQITFNAWFYVDHNLWATLVAEIFDKLFITIQGGPIPSEQAKKQIQQKLEEAEGLFNEARKELDDAIAVRNKAQKHLKTLVKYRQKKERKLSESLNDLGSLLAGNDQIKEQLDDVRKKMGLPDAVRSFQGLEEQLGQAQTLGRRVAMMALAIFQPPDVFLRIAALIVVFVAPVVVWLVVSKLTATQGFHDIATLLATAGSFATMASTWIAGQIKRGSGIISKAESVFAQLQEIREKRIQHDTAPQRAQLQQLQERESAAYKQVAEVEVRVQNLQHELAEMQPGARLQKFIRERSTSTDYSKHLGLVSLIRKDFQTLSDLLESREDIPVQRIVLYIDDLDRCPPNRVVQVLEAIHLLLAFRLFVVVVGVDARWVIRSLQREYRGLLTEVVAGGDHPEVATPHDYLEKIFQIPFWVNPMSKDASKGMITGLLPVRAATQNGSEKINNNNQGKEMTPENQVLLDEANNQGSDTKHDTASGPQSNIGNDATKPASVPKSSDPGKLVLKDFELEYIQELAPYIGRSPRRVKRFVNIYRLLRASIRPGADAVNFIGTRENPGEHRAALALLAVLTGAPILAPEIMKALREAPASHSVSKLRKKISENANGRGPSELEAALGALEFFRASNKEKNLRRLQKWEPLMVRYSFRPCEVASPDREPQKPAKQLN